MIRLKNITKIENTIKCDIFPEDSRECGMLIYNIDTDAIDAYELPKGYEWCKNHIMHAKTILIAMCSSDDIQDEKLIMWH